MVVPEEGGGAKGVIHVMTEDDLTWEVDPQYNK